MNLGNHYETIEPEVVVGPSSLHCHFNHVIGPNVNLLLDFLKIQQCAEYMVVVGF